ncbi:hypothetical protein CU012_1780 [Enterococcus faecium]|nr:hypothetical protein [Enterococcus faecium]
MHLAKFWLLPFDYPLIIWTSLYIPPRKATFSLIVTKKL